MSYYDDIATGTIQKLYLTSIHQLLSINVPKELSIYCEAANDVVKAVKGLKSPRSGPTIAEMGLKPSTIYQPTTDK